MKEPKWPYIVLGAGFCFLVLIGAMRQTESRKELANRPVYSTVDTSGTAVNSPVAADKKILVPRTSNLMTVWVPFGITGSADISMTTANGDAFDAGKVTLGPGNMLKIPVAGLQTTDSDGTAPSFVFIDVSSTTVSFQFDSFSAVPALN